MSPLDISYFGFGMGAAAALVADTEIPQVHAIASTGGHADLADHVIDAIKVPILCIAGQCDMPVIQWNQESLMRINPPDIGESRVHTINNRWTHRKIEEVQHHDRTLSFIVMSINFDHYAETGKAFVKKVAAELGDEADTHRAGQILRATLHVLRNQSTPTESLQFISQLPMFIKAIYVEGWKPLGRAGRVHHLKDFLAEVQRKTPDGVLSEVDCLLAVEAVLRVLHDYVSEGEMEDLRRTLPEELRSIFA